MRSFFLERLSAIVFLSGVECDRFCWLEGAIFERAIVLGEVRSF